MALDRVQNAGVDFVKCELEAAIRWAQLSQLEEKMGELQASGRARIQAEAAYATFLRFRPRVEHRLTEEDRRAIRKLQIELAQVMPGLVAAPPQEFPAAE